MDALERKKRQKQKVQEQQQQQLGNVRRGRRKGDTSLDSGVYSRSVGDALAFEWCFSCRDGWCGVVSI